MPSVNDATRSRARSTIGLLAALVIAAVSSHDRVSTEETWTIGNSRIQATLRLSADGLLVSGIVNPQTGATLTVGETATSGATVNGTTAALGASAAGWILEGVDHQASDTASRLVFTFRSTRAPVIAERTFACYEPSPTIEAWTTYRATGSSSVTIGNMKIWEITVPATLVHYSHGLRGDAAGAPVEDAFSLRTQRVDSVSPLTLIERNRSTEQYLPMIAADLREEEFFGGLAWSGSWQIQAQAVGAGVTRFSATLPNVTVAVDGGRPLETPHGFFGFTPGDRSDVGTALRGFVMQGVRGGRPFQPLVTSNTWFAYGTEIDEDSMREEMANAAANGVELFVVDAGWYAGAGRGSDFDAGLGTWRVDPVKFPEGLRPLSDYAHDLGLRFGIWVEPERVDQSTVGRPGLAQQSWLATNNGNPGSSRNPQICLASAAAREWVFERVSELIDQSNADYLKWDNNSWVNCTRSGHGHAASDGNFWHVKGLYEVLAALRDRYPNLLIENCSQGGNRADFGLLRYSDVGWMDDRTGPSVHVRHNLHGLTTFFPPAYLLSFAISHAGEPLSGAPDLGLYLRSRMPGILGLTYRAAELSEGDQFDMAREIGIYKSIRDIQREASAILLSAQAEPEGGPAWDVLEELSASTGEAVLFAFQQDRAIPAVAVQPRGLTAEAIYTISRANGLVLGSARGGDLMRDGITIEESAESAGHVLVLRPDRPPAAARSIDRSKGHE
ncbi:MAG TPA: glycoside hydrolase family 36 protein [Vicinamibacterales bacterium]|nr:glycoside hydrolase family 36 protein [Vicinamibacterales bacterium]